MRIGFVGVGVMGEPICRNLVVSGAEVTVFDPDPAPVERLVERGAAAAAALADVAAGAEAVFLSLPGGEQVDEVAETVVPAMAAGTALVDLSTSPVELTRAWAVRAAQHEVVWLDAPVARTRAAAEAGTLAVMVGGEADDVDAVRPLLATFATDISHCGPVGCGQIAKLMNNYVLMQNVVALGEAVTIAERSGMDPARLLEVISTGSGDSFALRNHATRAVVPGDYPERAFSVRYAAHDLEDALTLARSAGVATPGAEVARRLLAAADEVGDGDRYWPVIAERIRDADA